MAAGGLHTVVLTAEGGVYTFGCNDEGALGRETVEEEDNFEPRRVELPAPVQQVSAGDSHSLALTREGHVYIWGTFRVSSP